MSINGTSVKHSMPFFMPLQQNSDEKPILQVYNMLLGTQANVNDPTQEQNVSEFFYTSLFNSLESNSIRLHNCWSSQIAEALSFMLADNQRHLQRVHKNASQILSRMQEQLDLVNKFQDSFQRMVNDFYHRTQIPGPWESLPLYLEQIATSLRRFLYDSSLQPSERPQDRLPRVFSAFSKHSFESQTEQEKIIQHWFQDVMMVPQLKYLEPLLTFSFNVYDTHHNIEPYLSLLERLFRHFRERLEKELLVPVLLVDGSEAEIYSLCFELSFDSEPIESSISFSNSGTTTRATPKSGASFSSMSADPKQRAKERTEVSFEGASTRPSFVDAAKVGLEKAYQVLDYCGLIDPQKPFCKLEYVGAPPKAPFAHKSAGLAIAIAVVGKLFDAKAPHHTLITGSLSDDDENNITSVGGVEEKLRCCILDERVHQLILPADNRESFPQLPENYHKHKVWASLEQDNETLVFSKHRKEGYTKVVFASDFATALGLAFRQNVLAHQHLSMISQRPEQALSLPFSIKLDLELLKELSEGQEALLLYSGRDHFAFAGYLAKRHSEFELFRIPVAVHTNHIHQSGILNAIREVMRRRKPRRVITPQQVGRWVESLSDHVGIQLVVHVPANTSLSRFLELRDECHIWSLERPKSGVLYLLQEEALFQDLQEIQKNTGPLFVPQRDLRPLHQKLLSTSLKPLERRFYHRMVSRVMRKIQNTWSSPL